MDRNSCDEVEELRDEIDNLKAVINQYKSQIKATEAGERRLKEQLLNKESTFEQERKEMRALLAAEKRQVIRIQEESLKTKEEHQKKKNSILKEIMEKDEIIHKLSMQIHEMKKQARNQETLELEKKIKETVKDRSIYEDESEVRIKSTRGFGRARSPLINDKTISETVMYGGGTSVIDSIIGSFPQEQISILNSQEFDRRD